MSKSAVKHNSLQLIVRIVGSLLTLALLLYVLKKQHLLSHEGWQQIITKVTNIPLWQLLLVFVMMMISRTAVGGRWHVLWRASGAEVSWWQSIRLTYAGLFATNFLPTTVGGDVVRLAGALRYHCDSGACVASLLLDRFVGLAGMVLTVPLALPAIFSSGIVGVAHQHSQLPGAMPLAAGLAGGWQGKIAKFLQRLWAALAQGMRHPRALLQALLFTGVHMVCFFTIMYLLLRGMGEHATYWQVTGLWSVVYFITLIPISINGYGTQEAAITYFFYHYAGVSLTGVAALALVMRALTMLASLPGALFLPSLLPDVRKGAGSSTVTENAPVP